MSIHNYQALADLLKLKGITNPDVLSVIAKTPRHRFITPDMQPYSEEDTALPIGEAQTISQPYVVARMTEALLEHGPLDKVLEIGTGSGYQAAILSQLVKEVYSIERIDSLLKKANQTFEELGYRNIHTRHGDGHLGWPEHAPFSGIIVTAATHEVPNALLEQLGENANLIIPVGDSYSQSLQSITRHQGKLTTRTLDPVLFVPLKPGVRD